jgi:hypothetical protein
MVNRAVAADAVYDIVAESSWPFALGVREVKGVFAER